MRHYMAFVLCAATVLAQDPIKIGDVAVTGSVRARAYVWNWFEPTTGDNTYAYSGSIFRLNFLKKSKTFDWDVELAMPLLLGLPNAATTAKVFSLTTSR